MGVQAGEDFVLNVEDPALAGSYIPVADMNSYSKSRARSRSRHPVFGGTTHVTISPAEEDFTVGGFLNDTDAGQQALRDAADNNTIINVEVLFDGAKGFRQDVKVHTYTHDAEPEGLQEHGYEFTAVGVRTAQGGGPVL